MSIPIASLSWPRGRPSASISGSRSYDGLGQTVYDWRHYLSVIQRKPGALRDGEPFAELPVAAPVVDAPQALTLANEPKAKLERYHACAGPGRCVIPASAAKVIGNAAGLPHSPYRTPGGGKSQPSELPPHSGKRETGELS